MGLHAGRAAPSRARHDLYSERRGDMSFAFAVSVLFFRTASPLNFSPIFFIDHTSPSVVSNAGIDYCIEHISNEIDQRKYNRHRQATCLY